MTRCDKGRVKLAINVNNKYIPQVTNGLKLEPLSLHVLLKLVKEKETNVKTDTFLNSKMAFITICPSSDCKAYIGQYRNGILLSLLLIGQFIFQAIPILCNKSICTILSFIICMTQ